MVLALALASRLARALPSVTAARSTTTVVLLLTTVALVATLPLELVAVLLPPRLLLPPPKLPQPRLLPPLPRPRRYLRMGAALAPLAPPARVPPLVTVARSTAGADPRLTTAVPAASLPLVLVKLFV